MRVAEITASLAALLLAVLLAALFGGSAWNLTLLLGLMRWPLAARIVRVEVRSLIGREFLRAAWALGASPVHVARRHLVPHLAAPLLAAAGIVFGGAVVAEAALAFVGLGDPGVTSWGQMVAAGFAVFGLAWWVWLWPAAMLVMVSGLIAAAADLGDEGR
jgi:peptide/nickel transport system permease protein